MYNYPNLPWQTPPTYVDGRTADSSYMVPPQSTPFGQFHTSPTENSVNPNANAGNVGAIATGNVFNPGGRMLPGSNPRTALQALLAGLHQSPLFSGLAPRPNYQPHFEQVHAAQNLARQLAQLHTGSLRRFQL